MMYVSWNSFIYFALASLLLWGFGAYSAWRDNRKVALTATCMGIVVFLTFIVGLWMNLERPPLRTMGETRLWYAFFLPIAGIAVYSRWRYKWILSFSTMLSLVFVCVNIFKPDIHNKTLMPALQSPWFAPHVIVYMFCYAILGAATLMAIAALVGDRIKIKGKSIDSNHIHEPINNLVNIGLSFMTLGMLMGALWAKEAWGHYWAWDPKETWAAATWLLYLAYIHIGKTSQQTTLQAKYWLLIVAFLCLQMCWWGINYLPSAQAGSVHTYSMN